MQSRSDQPRPIFWILTAACLVSLAAAELLSVGNEAQTWDEGIEIAAGYSYLKTGEYRFSVGHPPLSRVLAALPLLVLGPTLPLADRSWATGDGVTFGRLFLYHNRIPAEKLLFASRAPMIAVAVILGLAIALWTRRLFGEWAAVGAVALYSFDPNIVAMGRYVKHDLLVTLFCLAAVACWGELLRGGRRRWVLLCGVACGLALSTKFGAAFLPVAFVALWAVTGGRTLKPLRAAASLAVVLAISSIVLLAAYAPGWRKMMPATRAYRAAHPEARRIGDRLTVATPRATAFMRLCTQIGLQDHPLLMGVTAFIDHASGVHHAYLLGQTSEAGWWYYFPVAFGVKTPVATLAALLAALALAGRRLIEGVRNVRLEWWLCAIPAVVYAILTLINRVNIGERHLFPIYPFLFAGIAGAIARCEWRPLRYAVPALAALLVIESAGIFPDYLTFFNFIAGGPDAGPRYLLDSNLDWGQGLLNVRDYWIARGRPPLCFDYFGTADLDYYGIPHEWVPRTGEAEARAQVNCLAAVSLTSLYGVYTDAGQFSWLRERRPDAIVGHSVYIYDLRKMRGLPGTGHVRIQPEKDRRELNLGLASYWYP